MDPDGVKGPSPNLLLWELFFDITAQAEYQKDNSFIKIVLGNWKDDLCTHTSIHTLIRPES